MWGTSLTLCLADLLTNQISQSITRGCVIPYDTLSTLQELCIIPHYKDDKVEPQLIPQSPTSKNYSVIYGLHRMTCHHDEELPADGLAYGGCAILEFIGMYWSPIL